MSKKMSKNKKSRFATNMNEETVDEIICSVLDYCGGIGIWNNVIEHMGECGYSQDELDEAMESFNKRCGRA